MVSSCSGRAVTRRSRAFHRISRFSNSTFARMTRCAPRSRPFAHSPAASTYLSTMPAFDEAKAVFETNFFGAHRVTAAALPLLRATRASKIINITSLSGLNALPFGSIYSASKWALEAYSESLRHEVKSLGISVSIVEPGAILSEKREPPHRPKETAQTYETARQHALDVIVGGDRTGIDATRVADCVIRVVHSRSPRLRYRVGADAKWLPRLKLLPWSWYERAIRWRYRLDV